MRDIKRLTKKRGAEKWDSGEKNGVVSCGKNPGGS